MVVVRGLVLAVGKNPVAGNQVAADQDIVGYMSD